jgi:hypothetical protein
MKRTCIAKRVLACVAACAAFALAREARAQTPVNGWAANRFNPGDVGSEWFAADALDFRGKARPVGGMTLEGAYNPVVISDGQGHDLGVQKQVWMLHIGVAGVFFNRFRVALNLPVPASQDGDPGTVGAYSYDPYVHNGEGEGVADVRLSADARIWGKYHSPFSIAAGAQLFLANGQPALYLGDGKPRFLPHVLVAGDIGRFAYAANLGFMVRSLNEDSPESPKGSEINLVMSAGARLLDDKKLLVGPELIASTTTSHAFKKEQTPVELLLGGHYWIADDIEIGMGLGAGVNAHFGAPEERLMANFVWLIGSPVGDRDKDGVGDDKDLCPNVAGDDSEDAEMRGCPKPDNRDSDRDGIPDRKDSCPDVRGPASDNPAKHGCPAKPND